MVNDRDPSTDALEQALRDQAQSMESTVSVNPLTGFQLGDLMTTGGKVALQAVLQPMILVNHIASQNRKLVDILAGNATYTPEKRDRRFQDPAFENNWFYKNLMQSYLALCETMDEWVTDLKLDEVGGNRAGFFMRVIRESIAPTNTLLGNPAALRRAAETWGLSIAKGLKNWVGDLRNNHGIPSQVCIDGFELGKTIGASPGAVVFRNEVLELIQYTASTETTHERPLLMVSAMINKFYALDLSPDRSMIKFCVDQGIQTFVVSWHNPGREHAHWGISAYAGAITEAVAAIQSITDSETINLFALCSGAMVSTAAFAHLAAIDQDVIHSMSIGVCMLDIQPEDKEFGAFANKTTLTAVKKRSKRAGILRGHELALSMLWLRPNDLIWSNVVNNYLLGNDPPSFDLLFWNNDWTNLTGALHGDFIDIFWTGCLTTPEAMTVCETPIDLTAIGGDKFIFGGLTDHITPWTACYRACHVFDGEIEFVLSNSGHMQTMLNSPTKKRASYFVNKELPQDPKSWLEGAELKEGSWWCYWMDWLRPRAGEQIPAPAMHGSEGYPALAEAPGTYVFKQAK